jgi:uncharacterized protein DUF3617
MTARGPDAVPATGRRAARSPVLRHQRSRCTGAWVALAFIAHALASESLAQDFPRLRAGLWEMQRSADRATAQPNRMTICLDDTVQKQMFDMGNGAMAGMCSRHDLRFSGNRGTGDFVCDIAGSRMHSKSTIVLTGNTAYRTEIHTTYDPPFMGQKESTTVLTAQHLGACKTGQRPGDVVMPNGQTLNVRDIMGGAQGRAPGAAQPAAPAPQSGAATAPKARAPAGERAPGNP